MNVAYADPPYIGQAKKHYSNDPKCAEVDHGQMIKSLCYYDCWALSLSSTTLQYVLAMCPGDVRIGAWVKPFCAYKKGVNPSYAWEPIIFRGARKRGIDEWFARDFVIAMPPAFDGSATTDVHGQKPIAFCYWLFDLLGMLPGDDFVDMYPGSGIVEKTWRLWKEQYCFLHPVSAAGDSAVQLRADM